ncbi:MAG: biopolymer transporter ExbD [Planctomycetaceae bacterium]|nr:biopolymer transporter ExbD [Planctomycetaceae bacterium]
MKIVDNQHEDESSINMTPMIDMVFLLLIFFLVATTLAQTERDQSVQLPGSDSQAPMSAQPKDTVINIGRDGAVKIGAKKYGDYPHYDAIVPVLAEMARNDPDREFLIRADRESLHEYFAKVVEKAHEAKINKAKIAYLLPADMVKNK